MSDAIWIHPFTTIGTNRTDCNPCVQFKTACAIAMDEAYRPMYPHNFVSSLFETLVLIGISLFVATVMLRTYIWVLARSHGQSMDEYMEGLADSIKNQSDKK